MYIGPLECTDEFFLKINLVSGRTLKNIFFMQPVEPGNSHMVVVNENERQSEHI